MVLGKLYDRAPYVTAKCSCVWVASSRDLVWLFVVTSKAFAARGRHHGVDSTFNPCMTPLAQSQVHPPAVGILCLCRAFASACTCFAEPGNGSRKAFEHERGLWCDEHVAYGAVPCACLHVLWLCPATCDECLPSVLFDASAMRISRWAFCISRCIWSWPAPGKMSPCGNDTRDDRQLSGAI